MLYYRGSGAGPWYWMLSTGCPPATRISRAPAAQPPVASIASCSQPHRCFARRIRFAMLTETGVSRLWRIGSAGLNARRPCRGKRIVGSRMVQKLKSCGLAVVVIQHSAESVVGLHPSAFRDRSFRSHDETVFESLMVPFQMIMRNEMSNRVSERIFTKENHLL
jgi:hypothetical protein